MPRVRLSIADRLLAAQVALDGLRDDAEIRAALAQYGYDDARVQQGWALYERAMALVNEQKEEYGEQLGATQTTLAAWDEADEAYTATLKIARMAFKGDPTAARSLVLDGQRGDSLADWLLQAMPFYTNLLRNPELIAGLSRYGYTQAKLQQEAALVQAVYDANATQEQEKGEAQTASKLRDAALRAMGQWQSEFKGVAQVALADNPQALEKLGFGPVP